MRELFPYTLVLQKKHLGFERAPVKRKTSFRSYAPLSQKHYGIKLCVRHNGVACLAPKDSDGFQQSQSAQNANVLTALDDYEE